MDTNTKKIKIRMSPSQKRKNYKKSYSNNKYNSPYNTPYNGYNTNYTNKSYKPDPSKKKSKTKFEDVNLGTIISPTKNNIHREKDKNTNMHSKLSGGGNTSVKPTMPVKQSPKPKKESPVRKSPQVKPAPLVRKSPQVKPAPLVRKSPQVKPISPVKNTPKSKQVSPVKRSPQRKQITPVKSLQKDKKTSPVKRSPNTLSKNQKDKKEKLTKKIKHNISKIEHPNVVKKHKQSVLDRFYSQKYSNPILRDISPRKPVKNTKEIKNKPKTSPKNSDIDKIIPKYKKHIVKTTMEFYRKPPSYFNENLLEKNSNNIRYFKKMPNIEDVYISSIISDGVNINFVTIGMLP